MMHTLATQSQWANDHPWLMLTMILLLLIVILTCVPVAVVGWLRAFQDPLDPNDDDT